MSGETRHTVLLLAIGAVLVVLVPAGIAALSLAGEASVPLFMTSICLAGALWLAAVALVRHGVLPHWMVWFVVGVAVLMRVTTLVASPLLSTDVYRYVWDGRVQMAGINPYRYVPAAPEVAFLRDDAVYPSINRAGYAPTVYPPAAEGVYALAAAVAPGVFGMKLVMAGFDALALGALTWLLRVADRPPAELLIYAWLPLPIWEFAGSAHVDAVAAGVLALALVVAARRRAVWTGILLAFATLTKFMPAVVVPAFWRPRDWRLPIAFACAVVVLYIPYLSVGWRVFGFLGGYVSEEGVESGHGIFLLQLLGSVATLPAWSGAAYIAGSLAVIGALAARFGFSGALPAAAGPRVLLVARQAAILGAAVLVAVSPHYPWYFAWLAPLACLAPIPSILWMLAAAPLLAHGAVEALIVPGAVYIPAAVLALRDLRRLPIPQHVIRSAS
jgi:alpha-1,6-mannosyltransferase